MKKLTQKQVEMLWGESGPYSQVRLCEETRILDDDVSRVFLVVEAEINPFTFEYVKKHRKEFIYDSTVLQLLDHAENKGVSGYVVSAGEVEISDESATAFARKQADITIQTLIRMHKFVMDSYGIKPNDRYGVIEDNTENTNHFIWNERLNNVIPVKDNFWENQTMIDGPAGVKNNSQRFFIVLAYTKNFDFKNEKTILFAKTLRKISSKLRVDIEDIESFHRYILIESLIPFDIAPADFIEDVIDKCNELTKKPIFQKDYFITNVKRPTPEQIMSFLGQLPLDKNIEFPL